jgi:tetratricopeptide (TPR) repeat protein
MPPQQHNIAQSGGVVYTVQHGDQYVYLYRNEPPYRVEPWPAGPPPMPEPLVHRAPSWLLSARHQVVPFYGRDQELAWLQDWRDSPTQGVSVRLVHGPGGQGKTRLAAQFAGACTRTGWTVAVARHRSEVAAASGGDQQLAVYQRGLVLVIDYAERWPLPDVLTLLGQHQAAASTPLRMLLLARPAGGWWQSLAHQFSKTNIEDVGQWELAPLAEHPGDRQAIYAAARDRFASVLGLTAPAATAGPELGESQFGLVLAVHMKALVDVDAAARGLTPPSGRDQAGLSSYLLDREHDYWRAAHQQGTGPVRTNEAGMCRAVYTATLTRALPHCDGVSALTRANMGEATTQPISQVLADHAVLYPPADPGTVLEPLYPDRLGEDFLALTTPGHTDSGHTRIQPWAAALPTQLLRAKDGDSYAPPYARAVITTLIEVAHRWPHLAERHLYPILRQWPRLALTAGGAALTRLAELPHPGILDVLEAIEPHLSEGRHVDLDPGIAALTATLTTHRLTTTTDPVDRAELYVTLSLRLDHAGQRQQALRAATEAVEIYRRLARGNPAVVEPNLAIALNNLGTALANLGRREEALAAITEAVRVYRRLARGNPSACEPELAGALINLGVMLSGLGRWEQALEASTDAVQIYRRLAGVNPAAFEPNLAMALANLVAVWSGLGRLEEALEASTDAVQIYRRLAGVNPAAFEPNLAMALANHGMMLSSPGRRQEALEATTDAIQIYRRLARVNRAVFEPDLARTLNLLANRLAEVGRRQEALEASTETVEIYRRLTAVHPTAFELDLARALNTLGYVLREVGLREEALRASTDAAQILRPLAGVNPATFEPALAEVLINLGVMLAGVGRREEALHASIEAVDAYRRLAGGNPAAFEPNLAMALTNLSSRLVQAGQHQQSLRAASEAVEIYRRLTKGNPAAFEPNLAMALTTLGMTLWGLGRLEEALEATTEAVEIRRRLTGVNPAAFEPDLAGTLDNRGAMLSNLGRREEALEATTQAVEIYRRLAGVNPAAIELNLAKAIANLAIMLWGQGRWEEALEATTETVEICRRAANTNPAASEPNLARGLWMFALARAAAQVELSQALTAANESVTIYEHLAQRQPEAFASALQGALATLGDVLNGLGRSNEATDIRHRIDQLTTELKTAGRGPRTPKVSLFRRWGRRA